MDVTLPSSGRAVGMERSPLRHVDLLLLGAFALLAAIGLMMVYSATNQSLLQFQQDPGFFLKKQSLFLVFGVVLLGVAAIVDYRLLKVYAPILYVLAVLLLLLVQTPLGSSALGAQRWFEVGGFQLSPSLFGRLAVLTMLAAFLADAKENLTLRNVVRVTTLALIPILLVFIQPDIGTSIVFAGILVAVLVASGAKARHLAILAAVAIIGILGAFQLHIVKDYQVQRLTSFLDPAADAQAAGYNKQQAEIAIGAGGLIGRGYLSGTQTSLDYVPAQHTDFIFTVVGEEFGFVGSVVLLGLFGLVLWRAFRIALLAQDPFGTFLAVGVAAMFSLQIFINIGMTVGIMPITGIPLPFLSYGGSALLADCIGIGLLLNVHARRFI